jgi:hypothetical protein
LLGSQAVLDHALGMSLLGTNAFFEGLLLAHSELSGERLLEAREIFLAVHANTAFKALSGVGEAASEAKQALINSASQSASQARTLAVRRKVQVELAGEKAVGTLEADLQLVIASDPKQWSISSQCEVPNGPVTG